MHPHFLARYGVVVSVPGGCRSELQSIEPRVWFRTGIVRHNSRLASLTYTPKHTLDFPLTMSGSIHFLCSGVANFATGCFKLVPSANTRRITILELHKRWHGSIEHQRALRRSYNEFRGLLA